ncbi:unnamed protein product [Prunus armeniaca]
MGPEFWFQVQRVDRALSNSQISDAQQLIDYVTAQCNISLEQDTLLGVGRNRSFPVNINDMSTEIQPQPFQAMRMKEMII